MNRRVGFIMGTGHCGSTLIDLVLGSHNKIFSLGEVKKISVNRIKGKEKFWNPELMKELKKHLRFRKNKLISYDYHRFPKSKIFENRSDFYKKIFGSSGSEVLIDSSKNLFWINRGFEHLKTSKIRPLIIYLKRNPCAVVNSYYRKYKDDRTFEDVVEFVKKSINENESFYSKFSNDDKIKIDYEKFCDDPVNTTKALCDFLGQDFNEDMLNYWEYDHFNISGNSGTNWLKGKYNGNDLLFNSQRNDANHYKNHPLAIRLDERWKTSLNDEQKQYIENAIKI